MELAVDAGAGSRGSEQVVSKQRPLGTRGLQHAEPRTTSFVIRLWVDEPEAAWHGHITHVQSDERQHVRSLRQVDAFISRHLAELGFRPPGLLRRIGRWR